MSYDLAVWTSDHRLSTREAAQRYGLLDQSHDAEEVDPRIEGFFSELSKRFPSLESLPESELDNAPWSVSPTPAADHVSLAISWSRAKDVFSVTQALAQKWDLVLFCPQTGNVYHPPRLDCPARFRLELEDGTCREDPSPTELSECLDRLRGSSSFAILERRDGHYVQARIGSMQGWVLEWQRGGLERHFACTRTSLGREVVTTAFNAFLVGDERGLEALGWERIQLQAG